MKFLDKLGLIIFSLLILLISSILCCAIFEWIEIGNVFSKITILTTSPDIKNITLGISIVLIILAIKCMFFRGNSKEEMSGKDGIVLENDNGKLLISKDTIENLTNSVVKSFDSAETVMTKVELDVENNIKIYVTLFVTQEAVIKDLTIKLQSNIKDTIKKSLDLDVKEVNVRIKNITPKKETNIKEQIGI